MEIYHIKPNMTEVTTDKARVLFSYSTPVAAYVFADRCYYKTSEHHSNTTSRHINQWLRDAGREPATIEERPQEFFDNLS